MITVGELKDKLANLDDDMIVIIEGNNGFGVDIENIAIEKRGMIYDDETKDRGVEDVLSLHIDSYVAEYEDLGYANTYVNEDTLNDYETDENDEDEDE